MVVVVVWVRISSLLISFLAHFFPKSTQNLYCIDSSQQLRFESFCYYSCLLHPSPLNSLRYFWEHAEKWIFFLDLQAVVEGLALKDILIRHLSKDPERQTRVVEVNKAMGRGC